MFALQAQFLVTAVKILCDSREQLMFSYIFTYFAEPCPEKGIYEMNQNDLQLATDNLSKCLMHTEAFDEVKNHAK